jgi:hypothetical protein
MKMILALAGALALAGCNLASLSVPTSPAALADRTTLDERAGLSVELAYQAANLAIRTANRAGLLAPSAKAKARALDDTAFAAVGKARAAYDAGNAASFKEADAAARNAVSDLLSLVKG